MEFKPPPPVFEVENPMYIVPYTPTPKKVIEKILEISNIKPGMIFCDLGCGDGRVLIEVAKRGAIGIGVEINEDLIKEAKAKVSQEKLEDKVFITHGDLFKFKYVSYADVIYMFLDAKGVELIKKFLEIHAKPGAKVISLTYPIPGWEPDEVVTVKLILEDRTLYIYTVKKEIKEVKKEISKEVNEVKLSSLDEFRNELKNLITNLCKKYKLRADESLTLRELTNIITPHLKNNQKYLISKLISIYEQCVYSQDTCNLNDAESIIKELRKELFSSE